MRNFSHALKHLEVCVYVADGTTSLTLAYFFLLKEFMRNISISCCRLYSKCTDMKWNRWHDFYFLEIQKSPSAYDDGEVHKEVNKSAKGETWRPSLVNFWWVRSIVIEMWDSCGEVQGRWVILMQLLRELNAWRFLSNFW